MGGLRLRGFGVSATVKKRLFGRTEVVIKITDGQNDIEFLNGGTFIVQTTKPLKTPILIKEF